MPEINESPVNSNEYDYALSFFEKVMPGGDSAKEFVTMLYTVSQASKISMIQLVESMRDQDLISVTITMAYYLNSVNSSSTLVGVQNIIKPNFYAARNVLK